MNSPARSPRSATASPRPRWAGASWAPAPPASPSTSSPTTGTSFPCPTNSATRRHARCPPSAHRARRPHGRHLRLRGVSFGFTRAAELGEVIAAAGRELLHAVADGRVRPLIDSTHTFTTATEALERLRSHRAHGKIVLTVD
ncbi:zinc-binding dehydrogenase [Streptomyces sp. NPDC058240]|uniref:zinc-binding dehydrogenase n=1 Tax=Streptomyces sp. NPDC058240 TaxID=3346396 RepID=UPI0036EFB996